MRNKKTEKSSLFRALQYSPLRRGNCRSLPKRCPRQNLLYQPGLDPGQHGPHFAAGRVAVCVISLIFEQADLEGACEPRAVEQGAKSEEGRVHEGIRRAQVSLFHDRIPTQLKQSFPTFKT